MKIHCWPLPCDSCIIEISQLIQGLLTKFMQNVIVHRVVEFILFQNYEKCLNYMFLYFRDFHPISSVHRRREPM
jgi:hypothetical protein